VVPAAVNPGNIGVAFDALSYASEDASVNDVVLDAVRGCGCAGAYTELVEDIANVTMNCALAEEEFGSRSRDWSCRLQ
jgi:hypothetical protein